MLDIDRGGPVAHVALNRPDIHNAFNADLIQALTSAFAELGADAAVRAIVLSGNGKSFCAGADLAWMRSLAEQDAARNAADALVLAALFETIDTCPKPVVGRVHGAAMGGGFGLVACCDVVVAGPKARFALTEVRLGMAPAVISPFVVRKIGSSRARELFLTGDAIDAATARDYGLVHRLASSDIELDGMVVAVIESLLKGSPSALAACKLLARDVAGWDHPAERTSKLIAELRVSPEGQEGMKAFLEKRAPGWIVEG